MYVLEEGVPTVAPMVTPKSTFTDWLRAGDIRAVAISWAASFIAPR
jgi:hypothetical protein